MKTLSRSFSGNASPDSPFFPNYLQPTQTSLTKHSPFQNKRQNNHIGRSFIYKQENIQGPLELSGKKKLLHPSDSGGSLLNLMERSDPYTMKTKKNISPEQRNNSYRVYMPELNCETPKFQGLKTYYNDFLQINPISNNVLGSKNHKNEHYIVPGGKDQYNDRNKENKIPCLPMQADKKNIGKKTFQKHHENLNIINHNKQMKNLIQGNYIKQTQEFSLNEEVIYKKPIKRPNINNKNQQNSSIFEGSYNNENNDSKNLGAKVLNHNKTYKNVNILPEGQEKTAKKTVMKYPNQKRIMEGDGAFWKNFRNRDNSGFHINESKVNNFKYDEYCKFMKKEKESLERYLNKENLENSQDSINMREHRKKQFPKSPIFRNNFQFG